ncbi:MAG: polysaccharide deacetylase family protein [Bacteroidales bacterium]|jgi:peptidoglycan/xylan/chitin deacetylase (PgdA/CDA1 family)|nr:polysaccharide deacetylase family protein [Bacteroidales bacterium]
MLTKERLAARIFRQLTWYFPQRKDEIFLTFDDGPTPEVTPWVLSVLKEYKARATFFCLGEKVEQYPGLFQQVIDEGHVVGNHSYSHLSGWNTRNQEYYKEICKASELIHSKLFRPPYGEITCKQIRQLKKEYHLVMWDVLSKDYDPSTLPEQCFKNVVEQSVSGSIVVFHDNLRAWKNLYYTLPRVLQYFSDKKFTFNPIILP